jgi:hypothetical protein
MKRIIMPGLTWLLLSWAVVQAQDSPKANTGAAPVSSASSITITPSSTPIELARAALAAQGGEKFKNLKSMMLAGTVDIYAPGSAQSIPGKFIWITAGERLRIELDARPIILFRQIYDGQRSYTSIPGLQLGVPKSFGLALLTKFDQPGYTVSALPDKKKLRGFRIADAEGHGTDFFVDPTTGRVMTYRISYKQYTFATENTKMDEVEGVLVPYKFTQKLEMPQGTFFAEFKVKDAKINQPVADDVFAIP